MSKKSTSEGVEAKRESRKKFKKKLIEKRNAWRRPRSNHKAWFEKVKDLRKKSKAPKEYILETNLNLRRLVLKKTPNKRAKRAIRDIKRFVRKRWKVRIVKIDHELNKYVWSQGRKNPPRKVRLVIERKKREDDEEEKRHDKYYCEVGIKPVADWTDPDIKQPKRGAIEQDDDEEGAEGEGDEEEEDDGEESEEMEDED